MSESEYEPDTAPEERELRGLFNAQTGRLGWNELARQFARGVVLVAAPGQDLVDIACCLARDESRRIEALVEDGQLTRALDDHARRWTETDAEFWAVVVAPWVLVQEIDPSEATTGPGLL